MKILRKIDEGFYEFERWFGLVLLSAIVLITFAQVLNNAFFKFTFLSWTEEVVRLCLVWFIMLSGCMAVKKLCQLSIDSLISKVHGTPRFVVNVIIMLFSIWTFYALARTGWFLTLKYLGDGSIYNISGIPLWVATAAFPFWFGCSGLRTILNLIYEFEKFLNERKEKSAVSAKGVAK